MSIKINQYNKETKTLQEKEIVEIKDIESGDGYIKYPDGTLIQWGKETSLAGAEFVIITFKIIFSLEPSFIATPIWVYESKVWMTASATHLTAKVYPRGDGYGITKNMSFHWQAIGRWK